MLGDWYLDNIKVIAGATLFGVLLSFIAFQIAIEVGMFAQSYSFRECLEALK